MSELISNRGLMALSSIFVVSVMILGLSFVSMDSEDSSAFVPSEWTYSTYDITIGDITDTYTLITAYSGSATSVILPSEIEGVIIDGIGTPANTASYAVFRGKTTLTSVNIPDSYKIIGCGVFDGCTGLTSIDLPAACTYIGDSAFLGCSGLTGALSLPSACTYIGSSAFLGCSGLTGALSLPSACTYIGSNSFYNCSGLTGALSLPSACTYIGDSAFSGCSGLTGALSLPAACTYIGGSAFIGCSGLTGALSLPAACTYIGSIAFYNCSGLTGALSLPSACTYIGSNAFASCKFSSYDASLPEYLSVQGPYIFSKNSEADSSLKINSSIVFNDSSFFANGFDVTFVSNVHLCYLNGTDDQIVTVETNTVATEPTSPVRSGYSFAGWIYSDGTLFDFSQPVTDNVYLYASWTAELDPVYTVTFNANGGINTASSMSVNSGDVAIEPCSPVKDGYVFTNWYTSSALTSVYDFATPITSNITLYAGYTDAVSLPDDDQNNNDDDDPNSEDPDYFTAFIIVLFLIFVGCYVHRRH